MLLEVGLARLGKLDGDELEATLLEAGDDGADEAALDTVRLDAVDAIKSVSHSHMNRSVRHRSRSIVGVSLAAGGDGEVRIEMFDILLSKREKTYAMKLSGKKCQHLVFHQPHRHGGW